MLAGPIGITIIIMLGLLVAINLYFLVSRTVEKRGNSKQVYSDFLLAHETMQTSFEAGQRLLKNAGYFTKRKIRKAIGEETMKQYM